MSEKPKPVQIYADQETKAILEMLAENEDRSLMAQLRVIIREAAEKRGIDLSQIHAVLSN